MLPPPLAKDPRRYFWECDSDRIDLEANAEYVIERVLEHGDLQAVRWAQQFYGEGRIRGFFLKGLGRRLSAPTRELWRLILGMTQEELCTAESSRPSKTRFWPH